MSARDTLLEHLSARQRAEFAKTGGFIVHGRWWRRYYLHPQTVIVRGSRRLWYGNSATVWNAYLPADDIVLALKLLLENDERCFRKRACRAH